MHRRFPLLLALVLSAVLFAPHSSAQSVSNLLPANKNNAPLPTPSDSLGRTSPRGSIYHFLEACHRGRYDLASHYLDLRSYTPDQRAADGPKLAEELSRLLDRNPNFEISNLSDAPEGDTTDGLRAVLEELATFDLNGEPVTLQLERVNTQRGELWLVAANSIRLIPELAGTLGDRPIEKHLPAPLVNIRLVGTPLWIWLALILVATLLSGISRLLSRGFLAAIKPLARRYAKALHEQRLEALSEPLRLLLSVIVFRACLPLISPGAILRDYVLKLLALLFMFGAASLLMRLVDVISDRVISKLDHRERALTYSVFPLGIRVIKIIIFCIGLLLVLQQWGYNTSTILAGVGVGGVAVALAAQKTIENLFGGVSLISDRPVLVGDFCKFGGQVGTVEDIGLRSTRIRTLDRTLVTVPNSQFSTMTLENYSKRDRMWFHPTVSLRRDTAPEKIEQMMDAIARILDEHEQVDASGVPLRFTKITDQTLDLEIFAYVLTPDFNVYLKVQSELLLSILRASYNLGIGLAVPFQEEYNFSVDADSHAPHPYLAFVNRNGDRPEMKSEKPLPQSDTTVRN